MTRISRMGTATFALVAGSMCFAVAEACSRMSWSTDGQGVFAARTMDWTHSFDDVIFVNPRGREMTGGVVNAATWTSKYGNVVASIQPYASKKGFGIDDGATDGISETGLTGHLLYLEATHYPEPDDRLGVSYMRWLRYALDNFATVAEAVEGMKNLRIEGVKVGDEILGAHLALEDPTGDSAIFEVLDGEMVIHHGSEFNIMTNDPPYDWQITHLAQYQGFGGQREIPGGIEGADRFVRLAHFTANLPEPQNPEQAAGYALSAIRSVAVPFGAPYFGLGGERSEYPTWWASVTDLERKRYYFNWAKNPNIVWLDLSGIDFSEGSNKRMVDPKKPALVGDVTSSLTTVAE